MYGVTGLEFDSPRSIKLFFFDPSLWGKGKSRFYYYIIRAMRNLHCPCEYFYICAITVCNKKKKYNYIHDLTKALKAICIISRHVNQLFKSVQINTIEFRLNIQIYIFIRENMGKSSDDVCYPRI